MRHVSTEGNFTKYSTSQSVPVQQQQGKAERLSHPEEPKKTWVQMECDMRDGNLAKTKEIWIKYGLWLLEKF